MTGAAAPITTWPDLVPHLLAVGPGGGGPTRHNLATGMPLESPAVGAAVRAAFGTAVADDRFTTMVGRYHGAHGNDVLREQLATRYAQRFDLPIGRDNVLVTPGAQAAFHYLSTLIAGRGQSVLFFGPEYPGYRTAEDVKYEMVPAEVRAGTGVEFRYGVPAGAVHPGVGAVLLSRPGNPAGAVLDDAELASLAEDCANAGAYLVVDNAYAPVLPDLAFREMGLPWGPHVVHVHSLSKAGLAGERIGFVIASREVVAELAAIQERVATFPPQLVQLAVSVLLRDDAFVDLCRAELRTAYLARHRLVADVLAECVTVPYGLHAADGGQFRWVHLPGLRVPSAELFHVLRDRGVLLAPSAPFFLPGLHGTPHARGCFRIGVTAPTASIEAGLRTFAEVVGEYH